MTWPSKETHQEQQPQQLPETLIVEIDSLLACYPERHAALIPALHACQDHFGFVSYGTALSLARHMDLAPSYIADTLSFYSMLRTEPSGEYHIEICQTLSCAVTGADFLADRLAERLGIGFGEVTPDGRFSLGKVECIGACEQAPAMLINNELYGNLDSGRIDAILAELEKKDVSS